VQNQNITLSLPQPLLKKAKILAAKRDTSVSAIVAASIEEAVRQDDEYEVAMEHLLSRAQRGYDLGSHGRRVAQRDELHGR
jgi:hypothetical protein